MPPLDARNQGQGGRARVGPAVGPVEALEGRQLMAYSALGFSLPDLTITAYQAPVASPGGGLAVHLDIFNQGASTLVEPLHLTQGSVSTADAVNTIVDVFAAPHPGLSGAVLVGTVSVPIVPQNSFVQVDQLITLPALPKGFPRIGGKLYLTYVVNPTEGVLESDYTNNVFYSRQPVLIEAALPNLRLIGFTVPSPLVPGDVIQPAIRIANLGAAATESQGPLVVQIVASQDKFYGPGDTILATYVVNNIPPLSATSSTNGLPGDPNLEPGANIVTLDNQVITLPRLPSTYYLGVKINPLNTIKEAPSHTSPAFDAYVKVGPPIPGLAPRTILGGGTSPTAGLQFPYPLGLVNANLTLNTTGAGGLILNNGASQAAAASGVTFGSIGRRTFPTGRPLSGTSPAVRGNPQSPVVVTTTPDGRSQSVTRP